MLYNIVARHISTPLGRDHSPPPLPHATTQLPARKPRLEEKNGQ